MRRTTLPLLAIAAQALFAVANHANATTNTSTITVQDQHISFRAFHGSVALNVSDILAGDSTTQPSPAAVTLTGIGGAQYGAISYKSGVVTYSPGPGFTGQDHFTYTATDGTSSATATVYVSNPFVGIAGSYGSPVSDPTVSPRTHQSSGYLNLTVDRAGAFSAKLVVAGIAYPCKGLLPFSGPFTTTLKANNHPTVNLAINLTTTGAYPGFSGTVGYTIGSTAYNATFNTGPNYLRSLPSQLSGVYTVVLGNNFPPVSSNPAPQSQPTFSGYAIVHVSNLGQARIAGKLSGGVSFSSTTMVQMGVTQPGLTGALPITVPVYAPIHLGSVVGSFGAVQSTATGGIPQGQFFLLGGNADWFSAVKLVPGASDKALQIAGSTYVLPLPGQAALLPDLAPNGPFSLQTVSNGTATNVSATGTLGAVPLLGKYNSTFTNSTGAVSLSIQAGSGLFSGSFRSPSSVAPESYTGVFLTLPSFGTSFPIGVGFYKVQNDSGSVQLFQSGT